MNLIAELEAHFTKVQDPLIATPMAAYMKNKFPFHGIKKPQRALIQRELFKKHPLQTEQELIQALEVLWDKPEREYQYVACDLAYNYKKLWTPQILTVFESLIRTKSWWDTVDILASKMIGTLLLQYPELLPSMDNWIEDEYLWIRRTALIYQLSYKEATNKKRLFSYCTKNYARTRVLHKEGYRLGTETVCSY